MLIKLDSGDYIDTKETKNVYQKDDGWYVTVQRKITDADFSRIVAAMDKEAHDAD